MNISIRNQLILQDEEHFARFLTGHYKMSNTRNKDFVNIVAFSKTDIEKVYNLSKLIKAIEGYNFRVFQDDRICKSKDLFMIYKNDDTRLVKNVKIIKREVLFF